jgi:hypothetical protein
MTTTSTVVRYRVLPGHEDRNAELVRDVYRELHALAPAGFTYATYRLGDGTFVHVAESEDGVAPLPRLPAFDRFRDGIADRCAEMPVTALAERVGAYRGG